MSATTKAIESLHKQLKEEKTAHARTRNELQAEITRWQRLARPKILDLMGQYPPLKKLLNVLAEAADLQDPSRGSPIEDTMRVEFIPDGNNASTSSTERGVLTHQRARNNVRFLNSELEYLRSKFTKDLEDRAHRMAQIVGTPEYEYELPTKPVCRREGCPERYEPQSFTSYRTGCVGCGRSFELKAKTG